MVVCQAWLQEIETLYNNGNIVYIKVSEVNNNTVSAVWPITSAAFNYSIPGSWLDADLGSALTANGTFSSVDYSISFVYNGLDGTNGTSGSSGISITGATGSSGSSGTSGVSGGGSAAKVFLTSQSLTTSGWFATGSFWGYTFSNANIGTQSIVNYIPYNDSYTECINSRLLPYNLVGASYSIFYSYYLPITTIIGDIQIF
jgi:hypothetical protein